MFVTNYFRELTFRKHNFVTFNQQRIASTNKIVIMKIPHSLFAFSIATYLCNFSVFIFYVALERRTSNNVKSSRHLSKYKFLADTTPHPNSISQIIKHTKKKKPNAKYQLNIVEKLNLNRIFLCNVLMRF